jgi:nucleotide-binding universal stress UspA family protein
MGLPIRSIVHPTDFSDLSSKAFAHALRIALAARCKLYLLHVATSADDYNEIALSHVRRLLAQWQLVDESDPPSALVAKLDVHIENVRLEPQSPTDGLVSFLKQDNHDLAVFGTHGRDGLERWLRGSIAESVFSHVAIPTLFVPLGARGFVDQVTGDIRFQRVLIPVDISPAPARAIEAVQRFGELLAVAKIATHFLHVGSSAPQLQIAAASTAQLSPVILRQGNIVDTIVEAATEFDVELIGMTTAGHRGILDALRGSTTERVIRHAPCPVLAVPAA